MKWAGTKAAALKRKKIRIKRKSAAAGNLFSVEVQCGKHLAGPLIACRCNNMN